MFTFKRPDFQVEHVMRLMLAVVSCVVILLGCGGDDDGGGGGAIAGNAQIFWSVANCPEGESLSIIAQAYDDANDYITYGGPWTCSTETGIISGITVGTNRKIVLFAEDPNGGFRYRGQENGIEIEENMTTPVDETQFYPFVATLTEPEDGVDVASSFSMNWNDLQEARVARFVIQISDDTEFANIVLEDSIPGRSYSPIGLDTGVVYYWRVICQDVFGNEGVASDVWKFTMLPPIATIEIPEGGAILSVDFNIDFKGKGEDQEEGLLPDEALVWFSDIDGQLGTGRTLEKKLSIGTHVITLTVTNSLGYTGSDSITITIREPEA